MNCRRDDQGALRDGNAVAFVQPPDVSVLIPIFNMETKLTRSVYSVLSQIDISFEVICVDDGSRDKSREIIKSIQDEDSRVLLICQENAGAGTARNKAISEANGKYLFFLDPDDWLPDSLTLRSLFDRCESNDLKVAGGNIDFYLPSGDKMNRVDPSLDFPGEGIISFQEYQIPYFFQRYLFRRDFIVENGFSFPNYRRFQDPIFLMRVLDAAGKIGITDRPVYCYESDSSHIAWNIEKLNHYYFAVCEMYEFAIYKGYEKLASIAVDCLLNYGAMTELLASDHKTICRAISIFGEVIKGQNECSDKRTNRLVRAASFLEKVCDRTIVRITYSKMRKKKWALRETARVVAWRFFPSLPNLRNKIRAFRSRNSD